MLSFVHLVRGLITSHALMLAGPYERARGRAAGASFAAAWIAHSAMPHMPTTACTATSRPPIGRVTSSIYAVARSVTAAHPSIHPST